MLPMAISFVLLAASKAVPGEFWGGALFLIVFGGISLSVFIFGFKSFLKSTGAKRGQDAFLMLWAVMFSSGGFIGFFMTANSASWLVVLLMVFMSVMVIMIMIVFVLMFVMLLTGNSITRSQ